MQLLTSRGGIGGLAHQTAYGHVHLESDSSDLTLCPDVKVVIPNDLGSLTSALEKKVGNDRVVNVGVIAFI
jgi:hypothetical protein